MAWFSQSKGGGGTTDTTARAQASAATSKIDAVYKASGDKVKANSTSFIVMSDGSIGQYSNPTAADITVPTPATDASVIAAGLSKPATTGKDSRLDNVYKIAGDSVAAGSEVFIVTNTGAVVNYANKTAAAITVPTPATKAAIEAAGFTTIAASTSSTEILKVTNSTRSSWATTQVDFTTAEPQLIPANLGKVYWNSKTGTGSISTTATFDKDDLYEMFADPTTSVISWQEYKPQEGYSVTSAGKTYIYTAGAFTLQPTDKHQHPFLTDVTPIGSASVIYRVVTGSDKLWKNAKANPDTTIAFTDPNWSTNWVEAFPKQSAAGLVLVADNDTLTSGVNHYSEPALNVVHHLTAPAAVKDSFYTVANTGKGIVDIGGTQLIGTGQLEFSSNAAGTSWVLTSREGVVQASTDKTCKTFTQTAHGFKVGQGLYHDGTSFKLADSTSETTSDAIGIVAEVTDANNFVLATEGYITGITQSGLTPGAVFLSATAGDLSIAAPTTGFFKPVMILDSATSGWVIQRPSTSLDMASSSGVDLLDAWLDQANTDYATKGAVSFSQIKSAILEEYKFFGSGTWDANDAYKSLNQFVSGVSGVDVSSFPMGIAKPQAFISEYYGDSTNGYQRLQVFGPPASSRGIWSRTRSASNWTAWQREAANNWQYTKNVSTPETITVYEGDNIVVNDGDTLQFDIAGSVMGCIICPANDWSKVPTFALSPAATTAGWSIVGTQPTKGTEAIHVIPGTVDKSWNVKKTTATASISGKTIHDFGLATVTPLKSADNGAECHFEGGVGYSITATDCADGDRFRLLNTSGSDQVGAFSFSGFDGAWLRDSVADTVLTSPVDIGVADAYDASVTKNGTKYYLNLVEFGGAQASTSTEMLGATDAIDGGTGLVPAPLMGEETKFLRGDGTWQSLPSYAPGEIKFAESQPDNNDKLSKVWIDVSQGGWPTYYRDDPANEDWPTSATGNTFDVLAKLTQAAVEDSASTDFGMVSGERLSQFLAKNLAIDSDITGGSTGKLIDAAQLKAHADNDRHLPDPSTLADGRVINVSNKKWVDTAPLQQTDVIFGSGTPEAGDTSHKVWVDTSTANWPVYYRALASDAWPSTSTGNMIENLVNLTKAQVEDNLSAVFGAVSGQRLAEAVNKHGAKPYVFADKTTVGAAVVSKPTIAEITTFANSKTPKARNQFIYYTDTDVATDTVNMAWYIDGDGIVKLIMDTRAPIIQVWKANSPVFPGCIRRFASPDVGSLIYAMYKTSLAAGMTAAAVDATELGKWDLVAQPGYGSWLSNTLYLVNMRVLWNNCVYRAQYTHKSPAAFTSSESKINWTKETAAFRLVIADNVVVLNGNTFTHLVAGADLSLTIAANQFDVFILKNIDGFSYTITPPSGETINGGANIISSTKDELLIFSKDASAWSVTRISSSTDSIQNISATGNITAWGSTVIIGATAPTANMTLTLPTATNNAGKKIKLVRVDNTTFTVTLAAQAGQTATLTNSGVELNAQNGALEVEAITATAIRQISHSPVLPQVTGLNYLNDISLNCTNVWTARDIGAITGFAAPDASTHYLAQRNIVFNASVTALTSEGSGLTIGFSIQIYRAGAWVDAYATTSVTNPSAGVVPFHRDTQIAVRTGEYIRFLTNANDGGGNTYPGSRSFRISLNEIPNATIIAPGNTVLTPRNITGSITATGYDGIQLPYIFPLPSGQIIDTVTLNGTTSTNFDANTGVIRITPNGGNVAVVVTTKAGATFNGLQRVELSTTELAITASLQDYTLTNKLQEGDLLEVQHQYNSNIAERQSVWVRVQAGSTQRNFPWSDATNNAHYWAFPNPLTNKFQVRQATASSSPRIMSVKVWRDAANGFVVPTGTVVATAYPITVNGGTNGTFTGHEGIGPEPFSITGIPADNEIDAFPTVAGVTLRNRQAGLFTVDRAAGAGALALTGITFRPMSANAYYFGNWDNQAGDSAATNGGHTCTRQRLLGTGITTANESLFTLVGGLYEVEVAINRHFAVNTWRNTILLVDGAQADSIYTGHDGSNWEGSGPLKWTVDATSASKTVQVRRGSSSGNGNCSGSLTIKRITPSVTPNGTKLAVPYTLTINGGANGTFTGYEGVGSQTFYLTNVPANNRIDAFPTVTGFSVANRLLNTITVDRAIGAGNLDLTGITFVTAETFKGLSPIGSWTPAGGQVDIENLTVTTNLDLRTAKYLVIGYRDASNGKHWESTWYDLDVIPDATDIFWGTRESGYGRIRIEDRSVGKIWMEDDSGGIMLTRVEMIGNMNYGYSVPTGTVTYTPRKITGAGIALNTVGRDDTAKTVYVTGIAAGSEVIQGNVTATNGATVLVEDSGRNGTAVLMVSVSGSDTVVTCTQTVWRRTLTATVNGSAGTINGVASANVNATAAVDFWLTLPANHLLTGAPVVTGGALAAWSADGSGVITPDNTGNITVTANSAQPGATSVYSVVNSGTWVAFGTIAIMIPASGNRSIQLRSNTGASIVCNYVTWLTWDGTRAPSANVTFTTTGGYLDSGWSFGNTGNSQQAIVHDTTSGKRYRLQAMINTSYNNIHYLIEDIS